MKETKELQKITINVYLNEFYCKKSHEKSLCNINAVLIEMANLLTVRCSWPNIRIKMSALNNLQVKLFQTSTKRDIFATTRESMRYWKIGLVALIPPHSNDNSYNYPKICVLLRSDLQVDPAEGKLFDLTCVVCQNGLKTKCCSLIWIKHYETDDGNHQQNHAKLLVFKSTSQQKQIFCQQCLGQIYEKHDNQMQWISKLNTLTNNAFQQTRAIKGYVHMCLGRDI
ncbi:hypothetical protein EGR_10323 [Echinococcus granulosus]|uniref:Uncharacterized protein n=1 Tax=Echinococcus granulosus TaxID=6210 RepID=W6U2N3_ECHGR|nr:hypothetical protein EGR_10323 [Echinococcus granulosus]EUB54816.1 hypothetical protein EGR_10323 [Echinococcus granulosus]